MEGQDPRATPETLASTGGGDPRDREAPWVVRVPPVALRGHHLPLWFLGTRVRPATAESRETAETLGTPACPVELVLRDAPGLWVRWVAVEALVHLER